MKHATGLYVRAKRSPSAARVAAIKRAVANSAERGRLTSKLAEAAREWASADAKFWAPLPPMRRASARVRVDRAEAKMRRIAAKIEALK